MALVLRNYRIKQDSGFSLLDLLSSILLSGIILGTGLSTMSRLVSLGKESRSLERHQFILSRATEAVRDIVLGVDSHRLDIPPVIHKNGNIEFSDGTANPVSLLRSTNRPSDLSDAISSIYVKTDQISFVRNLEDSGDTLNLQLCMIGDRVSDVTRVSDFLGISPDGIAQFSGEQISRTSPCSNWKLKETKSLVVKRPLDFDQRTLTATIPIEREFTYYVDSSGQLRYIGHQGGQNIENQPILRGIIDLKVSLETSNDHERFTLVAALNDRFGLRSSIQETHHLNVTSIHNLLINLPYEN